MKICATIAEFNPFHNGHAYLINSNKGGFDACIAVMSGNFVQRGAPAIFDKFSRARAAVANGADLVIELPTLYALSPAENFAMGAVKILNALNIVDTLFFGSECGDTEVLKEIAALSLNESEEFKAALKKNLASGLSYPKARAEAFKGIGVDGDVISSPNNILGIEYIKALMRVSSPIKPAASKRYGAAHDSKIASNSVASASLVRSLIEKGGFTQNFMPYYPYPRPVFEKQFSDIILYALRSLDGALLKDMYDCPPALASRFLASVSETDAESVIAKIKTKNFTESRIRRVLWNIVLKNTLSPTINPTYIRPLASNARGAEALSEIKRRSVLPLVSRGAEFKEDEIFSLEARATDIYNIARKIPSGEEFRNNLFRAD